MNGLGASLSTTTMKTITLLLIVVLVIAFELAHLEIDGGKQNDKLRGYSRLSQPTDERNLTKRDNFNTIKVIVEYNSLQGKEDAKRQALEITFESKRFNIVGMHIPIKALKPLQNNPHIQRVDLDLDVEAILAIEEPDDDEDETRRMLMEEVPWGIKAVQADQVPPGPHANEIKVCIIDTGYTLNHDDLPGLGTVTGTHSTKYSNRAGNKWYDDEKRHGSHAAGIIAALGDNNLGVVGILPNAGPTSFTLHISKGLDNDGRGSVSGVIEAIEGCIDAGSSIINMSLRVGKGFVPSFHHVLESAYKDHDIVLVAASGNDGDSTLSFPASYGSVMSVSAVKNVNKKDPYYTIAPFSQHNSRVEIAAPGVKIKSTVPDNKFKLRSGTSMAAPHVSGIATLLRSYNPTCSARQIREILLASSRDLGPSGCDEYFGFGMVRAKAAVNMLQKHGCNAANGMNLLDSNGMNDFGSLCKPVPYKETCSRGQETMTLNLLTDAHPYETSWVLMDARGIQVASANGYSRARTRYREWIPVCKGESYIFTVNDSNGDGMCCNEGQGNYHVKVGTTVVRANGGAFGKTETTTFTVPFPVQREQDSNKKIVRINAASKSDYIDPQGNTWVADTGFSTGNTFTTTNSISNTDKSTIYQSERFSPAMTYSIPLPSGTYDVSLHYAEVYFDEVGKRIFDVRMEGKLVSDNLDIFQQSNNRKDKALVVTTRDVVVNDGELTIDFRRVRNNAKISAIEVLPPSTQQAIFINAGGPSFRDSDDNLWLSDTGLYNRGSTYSTFESISNTDMPLLYQSERYQSRMKYEIPVTNGKYDVILYFAEIFEGAMRPGARVFNVSVENETMVNNLDIYKRAGSKGNKAYVISKRGVVVSDGSMTIDFTRVRNSAKISGIEIRPTA